jgi:hypothetical protein
LIRGIRGIRGIHAWGLPLLLALLFPACSRTSQDPVTDAFLVPEGASEDTLAACERIPFPELAITCRVQVAARAGAAGLPALCEKACARVEDDTWRQECHFRAGEELARAGQAMEALRHCVGAGRFGRFCLTHAGWALPPDEGVDSSLPPAEIQARVDLLLDRVARILRGAGDGLEGEGRDIFRSRAWFNVYFGTGVADPGPARAATADQAPFARTAFALEASRLLFPPEAPLPPDAADRILAVWSGLRPPPRGEPLPAGRRLGRYHPPVPAPAELESARIPVFGGGMRLVGRNDAEDLLLAALESLFFREATTAEAFLPWIADPRDRVRWTAARLFRLTPPHALDMETELLRLLDDPDDTVRWNARDALDARSWEPRGPDALRRGDRSGPRSAPVPSRGGGASGG